MSHMTGVKKDEVVQLNPNTVLNKAFAGCFMVVTEVKSFGCVGYINVPAIDRSEEVGLAYYRAKWEEMTKLENNSAIFVQG